MLAALVGYAFGGRRSAPAQAAPMLFAPMDTPIAPLALRPSPRVTVQTSAALLALALALDVSSPPQTFAAPAADGVYVAQAYDNYVLPEPEAQPWTAVELAPDWSYKAFSATDGWVI
jgi:hypothetical protein